MHHTLLLKERQAHLQGGGSIHSLRVRVHPEAASGKVRW